MYYNLQEFVTEPCTQLEDKVKVSHIRPRWPKGFRVGFSGRIFLTFGTTRVVGRHPYAPAAFTPGEIPGTHF